jgi:hypothetical protein
MKRKLTPTRLWWKIYWRQLRIIKRETAKQYMDTMIFGTGFVEVGPEVPDGIRHIPIQNVKVTIYQ